MNPLTAALVAVVLLAANGFFVAVEFALLAARRSRIEQLAAEGSRGAIAARRAQRELSFMLAGAQLGITMASLGLGAVAEPALAHVLEDVFERLGVPTGAVHPVAIVIALSIVVFIHMVVGEMAPKSWAITAPERSAVLLARPFRAFTGVLAPFLHFLNGSANAVIRLVGVTPSDGTETRGGPAELAVLLEESVDAGAMGTDEADRVSRALSLSGLVAGDVMVPRAVVDAVPVTAGLDHVEAAASVRRRSRLLVYGRDLDDVRGVVHLRDILALDPSQRDGCRADEFVYSVIWVTPETPVENTLLDMQQQRRHVAAVVDGERLVGILTMQDVLRHLIGRRPPPRPS